MEIVPTYNVDPRTFTWQHLEEMRLKSLGISNRYSRHLNARRMRNTNLIPQAYDMSAYGSYPLTTRSLGLEGSYIKEFSKVRTMKSNSLAPFSTMGKPTCGYFFSRNTNNRRTKFGIPPSNLVQWRSSC